MLLSFCFERYGRLSFWLLIYQIYVGFCSSLKRFIDHARFEFYCYRAEKTFKRDYFSLRSKESQAKKKLVRRKRLRRQGVSASSWLISLVIHFVLIGSLLYILMPAKEEQKPSVVTTSFITHEPYDEIIEKTEIVKEKLKVDLELEVPTIVVEKIVEDHHEMENKMETETAESIADLVSDDPLIGHGVLGNIGGSFGGSGAFGARSGRGKKRAVLKGGGSKETERAVEAALDWLKRHQLEDGSWDSGNTDNVRRMRGGVGSLTGLAILAFLASGHTPKVGRYHETVKAGIDWIISQQRNDGRWGDSGMQIYDTAICALALSECYGMYADKKIKRAASKAVYYLQHLKRKYVHYDVTNGGVAKSTSVAGWIVMALKSAKVAGLKVHKKSFKAYKKRIDDVTERELGERSIVNYCTLRNDENPVVINRMNYTMTAVGMLCNLYLGVYRSELSRQAEILMMRLPSWQKHRSIGFKRPGLGSLVNFDFYHCYYATLSLFQYGGKSWREWNEKMKEALLPNQNKGGPLDGSLEDVDGSWDPVTKYGCSEGRAFTTAMGALCLEVYYRYKSISDAKDL